MADHEIMAHDPRTSNDRENKRPTSNPALIAVELARQRGAVLVDQIDWEKVAEQADACDWPVDANTGEPL